MAVVDESALGSAVDKRAVPHRTNVMLAAQVVTRGLTLNVRIRNMSVSGALLEGSVLPEVGSRVLVNRGENSAQADIVWASSGRCGVRFVDLIDVANWTGLKISSTASALPASLRSAEDNIDELLPYRVGEELAYVQRMIDKLGDELAGHPFVVQRFTKGLQAFDLASQLLGQLARVLTAEDRARAASQVSVEALRNRLLR
jgi:hypothetical protein